jgi:hypothetical protein
VLLALSLHACYYLTRIRFGFWARPLYVLRRVRDGRQATSAAVIDGDRSQIALFDPPHPDLLFSCYGGVRGDLRQQLVAGVADITGYDYRFWGSAGIAQYRLGIELLSVVKKKEARLPSFTVTGSFSSPACKDARSAPSCPYDFLNAYVRLRWKP